MSTTVTRTFRMPREIDSQLQKKTRDLGFMNPSEYLRALVRKELETKETMKSGCRPYPRESGRAAVE